MQYLSIWTQDSLRSTENISYPNNDRILGEQLHAELFKAKNPSKKQTTSCDHGKKLAMSENWVHYIFELWGDFSDFIN